MLEVLAALLGLAVGAGASRLIRRPVVGPNTAMPPQTATPPRPGAPQQTTAPRQRATSTAGAHRGSEPPRTGPGRGLSLWLVADGTEHPVPGRRATVGRGGDCDVVIADDRISRHHATVRCDERSWMVRDEGSANGTRVREHDLEPGRPVRLHHGDRLWLGPVETRVVVGTGP